MIKDILIVGGGTAGWITAARLAKKYGPESSRPVSVTLIESPNIKTIGVGEGTWPSLRETLEAIGVSETEFIRDCGATFKQGGKFVSWVHDDPDEYYYHPFNLPAGHHEINLAGYWKSDNEATAFADAVDCQARLCEAGLAPKKITTPEFKAISNYAYHLDTNRFGEFLRNICKDKLGVTHIEADVEQVNCADDGYITSVSLADDSTVSADLFIDCTGGRSLLLGQTLGVKFKSCQDVLFVDHALAAQVPHDDSVPVACHTIATAQAAGWIWDIGLQYRRGIGHVYSSAHISDEEVEANLRRYINAIEPNKADDLTFRKIPIKNGYREQFWVKNCVAVGLSAGFVEPLEASAIMLLESAAKMITERLPVDRESMMTVSKMFNRAISERWERIVDFLKLHYAITKRTDNEFWIDNTRPEGMSDTLKEMLAMWRHLPPDELDFVTTSNVFPAASYLYVLLGMQYSCDYGGSMGDKRALSTAKKYLASTDHAYNRLVTELPSHRALLNAVCEHGMQPV